MTKFIDILQSDTTWAVIALLLAYAANSIVSRGLIAKLPPTSVWRRALRAAHGFLDRIDPKVLVLAFALPVLSGCSILKSPTFWDVAKETCKIALTASPAVQAEAGRRKLTGNEWASVLCELSDVVEQYVIEGDPKLATGRVMFITRAKGLVR